MVVLNCPLLPHTHIQKLALSLPTTTIITSNAAATTPLITIITALVAETGSREDVVAAQHEPIVGDEAGGH